MENSIIFFIFFETVPKVDCPLRAYHGVTNLRLGQVRSPKPLGFGPSRFRILSVGFGSEES